MYGRIGDVNVESKEFTLESVNGAELCLFSKIKCAILNCVLDFFCFTTAIHCRSPTGQSIQKFELIGGNRGAICSRYIYIRIFRE